MTAIFHPTPPPFVMVLGRYSVFSRVGLLAVLSISVFPYSLVMKYAHLVQANTQVQILRVLPHAGRDRGERDAAERGFVAEIVLDLGSTILRMGYWDFAWYRQRRFRE